MKRMFALVAAAALVAGGCQSPQPAYNPFMGSTVVPPPGTASPPPGQPYYGSPPGAPLLPPTTNVPPPTSSTIRPGAPNFAPVPAGGMSSSFTPNVSPQPPAAFPAPASAAPISSNPAPVSGMTAQTRPVYGPPGGNALPQRLATAPGSAGGSMGGAAVSGTPAAQAPVAQPTLAHSPPGWSAPAGATSSDASSNNQPAAASALSNNVADSSATRGRVTPASFTTPSPAIRIVDPPATAPSTLSASSSPSAATSSPPNRKASPTRVPEIGELPAFSGRSAPTATLAPLSATPTAAGAGNGSGTVWSRPSSASSSPDQAASGFGYDPQYRWLKGKLEYSQATQTWRLRYIPPDGATDNYGGSVVLSDASRLGGLKPGDLVYAEGTAGAASATTGSFAPIYALQRIAKQ